MNVPFLDLKAQHAAIKEEVADALQQVMEKTAFAGGPYVKAFEDDFASFCGCTHCAGVGSGTEALWAALIALGVGPGDEVITAANTFIATAEAVSFCGAKPVFVDVEEKTCNIDPAKIEKAITPKTKALIPVHLFGQTADMDPVMELAKKHKLAVIEDASQAHDAEYKGRRAGSIGDAGCFSFYPGKNLGAYGEAGAVVTNSSEIDAKIKMFRDHGQSKKYHHSMIGWNGRMDGFQGAVLSVKLKHLPAWTESRRKNARMYNEMLSGIDGIELPVEEAHNKHVYHLYVIRMKNRDAVMTHLQDNGVACGIHYPVPLHLTDAYRSLKYDRGDFPVAEQCADEYISLPMFPELTEEHIRYVAEILKKL